MWLHYRVVGCLPLALTGVDGGPRATGQFQSLFYVRLYVRCLRKGFVALSAFVGRFVKYGGWRRSTSWGRVEYFNWVSGLFKDFSSFVNTSHLHRGIFDRGDLVISFLFRGCNLDAYCVGG